MPKSAPKLTVITPYAGGDDFPYLLQSLLQQSLDPEIFEFILVADGPIDCATILRQFNFRFQVTVLPFERPPGFEGHSAGLCRNAAARLAIGETLLFVDSDCVLHPDCLNTHFNIMAGDPNLALGGAIKELPAGRRELLEKGFFSSYEELSGSSLTDHRSTPGKDEHPPTGEGWDFWYSGNASVSRAAFWGVGGFDTTGHRYHDVELAYRLFKYGVKLQYAPSAESLHLEHFRSLSFRKEQIKGIVYLGTKHPELASYAEDRLVCAERSLRATAERCESKFLQVIRHLEGVRAGFFWIASPGTKLEELSVLLNGIPYHVETYDDHRRLRLRLHRNCWDYNILLPPTDGIEHPEITVILPVFNGERLILRAIQSVLLQTCQSFEIIVVDDGSTDCTQQVIEPIWGDPRVRVTSLRKNLGLSYALNIGLELSRAPIVVQLDADDWFERSALDTILRYFRADETLGAIYGDGFIHDSRGNIFEPVGRQLDDPTDYFEYANCQVPRAYRRNALIDLGGWRVADAFEGRFYEDRLTLARMTEAHKVAWIPERLYHVQEHAQSLYWSDPQTSAAAKLPILWEQASRNGHLLSTAFDGSLLRANFKQEAVTSPTTSWSVIIPFHRSFAQLLNSVRSWLESDLLTTIGEVVIVDDCSDEAAAQIVEMDPQRIRVVRLDSQKGPAFARNLGASMARYEMLFFSDADHIVPPNVLGQHERRHRSCHQEVIVIGNVFGRRTALTVASDCRQEHKGRLLDTLRFDKNFETVASKLAADETVSLGTDSNASIWKTAHDLSFTDRWTRGWATLLIEHGENLQGYAHRWTRVSSGSMSITARTLDKLGWFDETFWSMEDWELGLRAQQNQIEILCAPESEPYHQIHAVDAARARYEYEGAHLLAAKHREAVNLMLHEKNQRSPAAASIEAMLDMKISGAEAGSEANTSPEVTAQRYCVLTFDDGPHALGTPLILEVLQRYNCQATFFFLGLEAEKYKDLARQTAELGHEIGVHGWAHSATRLTAREHFATLSKAIRVIEETCGTTVRYTRPPYGKLSASYAAAAEQLNLQVVGWDLSAEDYAAPSHRDIIKTIAANGIRNKVLLFHDGSGDPFLTAKALDWLLRTCSNSGIKLLSLANLSQLRNLPSLPMLSLNR